MKKKGTSDENILEKIYGSVLKFLGPLSPEQTYSTIVKEAISLVRGEDGLIQLVKDGELENVYGSTPSAAVAVSRRRGFTYESFKKRKAFVLALDDFGSVHPDMRKQGFRSALFIPLSYRNESVGVLVVRAFKNQSFSERELNILKLFGSMASLAIRKTQLYDETKKALETRDLFISLAAHELRTPLTAVHGFIQLLYGKLANKDTSESRWVEQALWESRRLTLLVNELLEINKIKTGQLHYDFKEVDLQVLLKRSANNFKFSHPTNRLIIRDLVNDKTAVVVGDFDKLLQVLTNLLDNAAKFSSENGLVEILLKNKASSYILQVKDYGSGIASKDLDQVFKGFYKGTNNSKEGMGLGLFLSKNIIDRHHGEISIKSKSGKGTTMEIELPKTKI